MNKWEEQEKRLEDQENIIIQDKRKGLSEPVFLGDIVSFYVEISDFVNGFLSVDGYFYL